jgi:AcrR family transcriptional regulator
MTTTATKHRILAEAEEVVAAEGARAVTMRGVAARVGVTPMALYRHFAGRDALMAAIVDEAQATFFQYLQRSLAESTAERRFFAAGGQYLAFALEHRRRYAVLFMEPVSSASETTAAGTVWKDAVTFRFLVDRIRDCTAEGVLAVGDPEDAALTVWAHVHGLVSLHLAGKLPVDDTRFHAIYRRSVRDLARAFGWRASTGATRRSGRSIRRTARR